MKARWHLAALMGAAALSACGQRGDLVRKPAEPGPAVATGENSAANFAELTTPGTQARPQRSDEVLLRSEERRSDQFDLPPE